MSIVSARSDKSRGNETKKGCFVRRPLPLGENREEKVERREEERENEEGKVEVMKKMEMSVEGTKRAALPHTHSIGRSGKKETG